MIPTLCETAVCAVVMFAGALQAATARPALSGYLSAYGEAPTVGTIAYRQSVDDIPSDISQFDVMIAVSDCMLIGREATLYTAVGAFDAIVFDCAGNDGTVGWMAENSIVAEVDYFFWQAHPELLGAAAVLVMGGE